MKPRAWVTVLVSAVSGALVWALAPWLTGHQEPWDADGLFYFSCGSGIGRVNSPTLGKPTF